MASAPVLLSLSALFLVLASTALAQTAPAPAPAGPLNLTGILDKGGQFTFFIRLLAETQAGIQIQNQLNTTTEGFTVLAPTDNAFNNLNSGTINDLSQDQKVQLVLYHILPKFYSMSDFEFVTNPVRTEASNHDGKVYGIKITAQNHQVNVSSGEVETQINNALYQKKPLAVYQLDKVLLPAEFSGDKAPAEAPSPATKKSSPAAGSKSNSSSADEPASADNASGSSGRNMGLGLTVGLALICMAALS